MLIYSGYPTTSEMKTLRWLMHALKPYAFRICSGILRMFSVLELGHFISQIWVLWASPLPQWRAIWRKDNNISKTTPSPMVLYHTRKGHICIIIAKHMFPYTTSSLVWLICIMPIDGAQFLITAPNASFGRWEVQTIVSMLSLSYPFIFLIRLCCLLVLLDYYR